MIAVVNYGMGNLGSVKNAFDYINVESFVSEDAEKLSIADALVLPGVGAFGDAMDNLRNRGLEDPVKEHIRKGKPFLGICLGLQMLFENNAALASAFFGRRLGVLAAGAAADLIVVDHVPFTPLGPQNVFGHLLFGAAAERVDTAICAGKVLMRGGQLQTLDGEAIGRKSFERSGRIWERVAQL